MKYIGDQALVLTIVECKGLEFQDVLLYNFFGSSPLSNQWRVVYEFLKERDLLDANSPSFPSFSQSKHSIMCSELKQLYVAITRTRQRLWICENDVELSKPMLDYWKRLCLVQVRKIDDSLAEAMQRASSPEEWKSQGIKLFWEKNYEMATLCFEKAGDETWEKRAKASGLRSSADTLRASNPEESRTMLREAAEIFDAIGRTESAAECFCDLGEYDRAGNIYLKCGKPDLRKSGDCFFLAGSYRIAAEVYADGNFFNECLSACTKANFFDLGLQYIEQWKQQASHSSGAVTKFSEIGKIAQEFLEKVALECYKKKDSASLMKFVRAFNTMESKRNFLVSLDCVEELLILEEESGNFNEAAEIAKRLGDVLCEVKLLEKAGQFSDASLLILSYVLSNSLWSSSSQKGWSLKSFPQKEELLTKAMSIAKKVPGSFHSLVCAEVNVLMSHEQRDFPTLMQCYISSKQYGTRSGEVLSVRKLLDAHVQVRQGAYELNPELHDDPKLFDDKILRNQVSCRTLIYVWNLWKENVMEILACLDSLEGVDLCSCEGTVQFCFNYFGVRLTPNLNGAYLLLKPDAAWVGSVVDKRFVVRNRKVATLEARHFALAALKYWRQELVSTGLKVLEALQALDKSSVLKSSSKYCQSLCITSIYEVASFFIETTSLDLKKGDEWRVQDSLRLSMKYSDLAFPLDSRQSLHENLISLKETEISKNLLCEIVLRNTSSQNELTYGQIGRVMMIMLGSGKPKHDLCEKISERLGSISPWKPFIENMVGSFSSSELHKLLEESFYVRWRGNDSISPNCFFYLVERLLISLPYPQGFFFTAKSSFVGCLSYLQSDANPSSSFVTDENFYHQDVIEFVFGVVQQCLYNPRDTAGWIKRCSINSNHYLPVLMLRLFMILCSLCLNSCVSFNVLLKALGAPHIRSQLPVEFCEALFRRKTNNSSFPVVIAEAFKIIGDPLVIVSSSDSRPNFVPEAIFVDLRSYSCKKEILQFLFPETACFQSTSVERNVTMSSVPPVVGDQALERNVTISTVPTVDSVEAESHSENEKEKVQINWALIREMSVALESFSNKDDDDEDLKILLLEKKVEVVEHTKFLLSAMALSGEGNETCEVTGWLGELSMIYHLLDSSDVDFKAHSILIGELLTRLEARSPEIDAVLLSRFTLEENDPNAASVTTDDSKNSISVHVNEDSFVAADGDGGDNDIEGVGDDNDRNKGPGDDKNSKKGKNKNKKSKKKKGSKRK